mmetsp:Transcript_15954/g.20162  ORF Transcript_15954/g.20162 Transcript_15954/m.20162 type:complete len:93 (-) Transcript_15954:265-543(-)
MSTRRVIKLVFEHLNVLLGGIAVLLLGLGHHAGVLLYDHVFFEARVSLLGPKQGVVAHVLATGVIKADDRPLQLTVRSERTCDFLFGEARAF